MTPEQALSVLNAIDAEERNFEQMRLGRKRVGEVIESYRQILRELPELVKQRDVVVSETADRAVAAQNEHDKLMARLRKEHDDLVATQAARIAPLRAEVEVLEKEVHEARANHDAEMKSLRDIRQQYIDENEALSKEHMQLVAAHEEFKKKIGL